MPFRLFTRCCLLLIVLATVFAGQAEALKSLDCADFAGYWCEYEPYGDARNSCWHSVFWYCWYN